jgi:hypothetical protein
MSFIYPAFLFALSALAIPVIIHLFNFRKFKKVYFPNVRLLKEVKQETQSKSKLRHLLVLASRVAALAFLVLAFAQPYIPVDQNQKIKGENLISIYIDNSFSMEALGTNGTLFDEAKKKAEEIASAYQPSDRFQLLTNDFEGKHQRGLSREEFIETLEEVKVSPSVKNISEVYSRQADFLKGISSDNRLAFILSDFQKSISDIEKIKPDSLLNVRLVPLKAQSINNLYIDSVWFESPVRKLNSAEVLNVKITNASPKGFENVPIKLFINGQSKTPASFDIEANSSETVALSFTMKEPGLHSGSVKITDYPITYDDDFYFSFKISENIPVMVINNEKENPYLNSLLGRDEFFKLKNVTDKNLDYSSLGSYRLIVLNGLKSIASGMVQEFKRFIEEGGNLLIFPGKDSDIPAYQNLLSGINADYLTVLDTIDIKITFINHEHELFKNVFEKQPENYSSPVAFSRYVINRTSRSNEEALLKLQNGDLFLGKYQFGKGALYLCASPLSAEYTDFPRHALFVPIVYNIALFSESSDNLYYDISKDEFIETQRNPGQSDLIYHIINPETGFDLIPEIKMMNNKNILMLHGQIIHHGNYQLMASEKSIDVISYNFNRKESDLSTYPSSELENQMNLAGLNNFQILESSAKEMGVLINEAALGKRLWKYCIIFALLFLGVETILLRFFKN